jgi:predicted nucleic acid-binding protein
MLVVDASAMVEAVLERPATEEIHSRIAASDVQAPHLIDIEVVSALRRLSAHRKVTGERARGALSDFLSLSVKRYPHSILAPRVWELRENFNPYDAVYLALAEHLGEDGVPLLTVDARFARAARKHTGVEVLLAA